MPKFVVGEGFEGEGGKIADERSLRMLAKKNLKGLFYGGLITGLVFSATLWTGIPVRAQVESLEEQLTETEAKIAEQAQIISQIADNYFKVTGELNEKIASLETINAEQAQTIKQITDTYFRTTGELDSKLDLFTAQSASLEATNAEQAQTIKRVTDNFFKVTGELDYKVASLERVKTEQKEQIVDLDLEIGGLKLKIRGLKTTTLFIGVGGLIAGYAFGGGFK